MLKVILNKIEGISFFKLSQFFLKIFLIIFPFQIRAVIFREDFFLTGNFNNYNSFFVYAGDLILISALIFWGLAYIFNELEWEISIGDNWLTALIASFVIVILIQTIVNNTYQFPVFFALRFILLFVLYILLSNELLDRNKVIDFLIIGMLIQVLIAGAQFFRQQSVGMSFLGEPDLNIYSGGVAKIDLADTKVLRAYGTFLHPNILSAALFFCIMLVVGKFKNKVNTFAILTLVFCFGMVLTFSRSGILALLVGLFIFFSISEKKDNYKNLVFVFFSLIFFIVILNLQNIFWDRFIIGNDGLSSIERVNYMEISKHMLRDNPMGVGLGNFTQLMQNYSGLKFNPWEMQPVHNTFMLILNETGIIGGMIFGSIFFYVFFRLVYLIKRINSNSQDKTFAYVLVSILCGMIFLACFDHYFFTSYQALVILFIYLGLTGELLKKFAFPRKKS